MTSQSQSDGAAQVAGDRSRETNKAFPTPPPRTRTMGKPSPSTILTQAAELPEYALRLAADLAREAGE